ncbi:MAG: NupC/NupG family nucleoside CNT transporter [Synergistes sp.]|nr:NupC/NupG family nucleoside CNT transporter [Synergistes sp.]
MTILLNLLGIAAVLFICWLFSWKKKDIDWKTAVKLLLVQFIIAFIIVRFPPGQKCISIISDGVVAVINCGYEGLRFVFGDLCDSSKMAVFLVQALGNIIFISAFVAILQYYGILGFVVKWIGKGVGKIAGTTEPESFVAVTNVFMGVTESPVLIRHYLSGMTASEIFVVLISGMGSMSTSILGGYYALGIPMEYLLIASTLVPFGSILVSKIILPQTEVPSEISNAKIAESEIAKNVVDAISEGALIGMRLVLSISAVLVAFIGLTALANLFLGFFGVTFTQILSYVFAPFGFLMGLQGEDIFFEGALLGKKMIMNEFVAFADLGPVIANLDYRTAVVCAVSLSGFANVGSMGVSIGGLGVLCPDKRAEVARLVFRGMIGGMLVSILSALLVSLVLLF